MEYYTFVDIYEWCLHASVTLCNSTRWNMQISQKDSGKYH